MSVKSISEGKIIALAIVTAMLLCGVGDIISNKSVQTAKETEGIGLPIIMYHSVLKDSKNKTKYVVSPTQLEEDLKWLKDNGYTPVVMKDIISYVFDGTPLPEKPVVITFDDGYYNNYLYAYPLLKQYNMKAVISVVGSFSEEFSESQDLNPSYAHLTWDNIKEMSESGIIEIQNHSYSMHSNKTRKGASIMSGEKESEYSAILTSDTMKLQVKLSNSCMVTPTTYTYPFGYICDESEKILKQLGFLSTLSCYEKVNTITRNPECLYKLGRFNRDSRMTTADFMSKLTK